MKKMAILLALLILALAGCGGDDLTGLWVDVDFPNDNIKLNSDGTGTKDIGGRVLSFTWEAEDGRLCVTYDDDSGGCDDYKVDGDRMTIQLEELDYIVRYERWMGD